MLTLMLAILLPGVAMADQPHIPEPAPTEIWDVWDPTGPARWVPPEPWSRLADCESGDWLNGGSSFVAGSARWDWGADIDRLPPWASLIDRGEGIGAQFHGGLQFHPNTWSWVAPDVLDDPPTYAYQATPAEQVAVAIETQRRQGWEAWPVCSTKVGLR